MVRKLGKLFPGCGFLLPVEPPPHRCRLRPASRFGRGEMLRSGSNAGAGWACLDGLIKNPVVAIRSARAEEMRLALRVLGKRSQFVSGQTCKPFLNFTQRRRLVDCEPSELVNDRLKFCVGLVHPRIRLSLPRDVPLPLGQRSKLDPARRHAQLCSLRVLARHGSPPPPPEGRSARAKVEAVKPTTGSYPGPRHVQPCLICPARANCPLWTSQPLPRGIFLGSEI